MQGGKSVCVLIDLKELSTSMSSSEKLINHQFQAIGFFLCMHQYQFLLPYDLT